MDRHLFADWRYAADGSPRPDFVMNRPEMAGRPFLLAGENFGGGSSREHAPWALTAAGIQVILATSVADIFRSNALKNGLIPVILEAKIFAELAAALVATPELELAVDVSSATLHLPDGRDIAFPIDPFAQKMLLMGTDEMGYLRALEPRIRTFESARGANQFTTLGD